MTLCAALSFFLFTTHSWFFLARQFCRFHLIWLKMQNWLSAVTRDLHETSLFNFHWLCYLPRQIEVGSLDTFLALLTLSMYIFVHSFTLPITQLLSGSLSHFLTRLPIFRMHSNEWYERFQILNWFCYRNIYREIYICIEGERDILWVTLEREKINENETVCVYIRDS